MGAGKAAGRIEYGEERKLSGASSAPDRLECAAAPFPQAIVRLRRRLTCIEFVIVVFIVAEATRSRALDERCDKQRRCG